jgi:hypothetical protein
MSKRKPPKAWVAYKFAKIGKRLGTVYGETEKEALANAQKEFAKTEMAKSLWTDGRHSKVAHSAAGLCSRASWKRSIERGYRMLLPLITKHSPAT